MARSGKSYPTLRRVVLYVKQVVDVRGNGIIFSVIPLLCRAYIYIVRFVWLFGVKVHCNKPVLYCLQ